MVNVITSVIIAPGRLNRSSRANRWVNVAEVKRGGAPGKLGMLTRGAQSEGLRQRRQSGVMDINGGLRQGVH